MGIKDLSDLIRPGFEEDVGVNGCKGVVWELLDLRSESCGYITWGKAGFYCFFTFSFKSLLFRQVSSRSHHYYIYSPYTMSSTTNDGSKADTAITATSTHGGPSSPTFPPLSPVDRYIAEKLVQLSTLTPALDKNALVLDGQSTSPGTDFADEDTVAASASGIVCETCNKSFPNSRLASLNRNHYIPPRTSRASKRKPLTAKPRSHGTFPDSEKQSGTSRAGN